MSRIVRFTAAAALSIAAATLVAAPAAQAKGNKLKSHINKCVFAAHGSDAEKENSKPSGAGGGGGGKPTKTCGKVFAKWSDSSVTVYVSDANAPAGFGNALSSYTQDCFNEWACHSGLSWSYASSAGAADVTITWGNLGSQGVLGQTSTSYFGGLISSSDVVMNSNQAAFSWTNGPGLTKDASGCEVEVGNGNTGSSNYDIFSVLLHEIGHSVGISHPTSRCAITDSCYHETMNPCTDAEEFERRALNAGDISAIQTNYGN